MYRQRSHYLHVPRSFTSFRMTGGRRESPCAQQTQPFCATCGPCGPAPPFFLPGSTGGTKANPVTSLPTPERGGWRAQRAGRGQPQSGLYNSLPGRAIHNPQRPKDAVKPKNLRPQSGRQTLELFPQPFSTTLLHNPPPTGGHNPRDEAPSTLTPKACPKTLFERKRLYAV